MLIVDIVTVKKKTRVTLRLRIKYFAMPNSPLDLSRIFLHVKNVSFITFCKTSKDMVKTSFTRPHSQLTSTCSKSAIESLEKGEKYVQS